MWKKSQEKLVPAFGPLESRERADIGPDLGYCHPRGGDAYVRRENLSFVFCVGGLEAQKDFKSVGLSSPFRP